MERLLAKLERRLGRYAVDRLSVVIVGGMAAAFVLGQIQPNLMPLLTLEPELVMRGQVWRLFTYLFIPRGSLFWIIFELYWVYLIGTSLESEWGAFKFNVFYLLGMIGTTVAAFATGGSAGNSWLNTSLLFAFATVFPNFEIYPLFFVPISVRVKWIAFLSLAFVGWAFLEGSWVARGAMIAAFGNYLLFFSGHLVGLWRGRNLGVRQAARRASFRPEPPVVAGRSCAICGAREADGADIRVCSCARCGAPRNLCLPHARSH